MVGSRQIDIEPPAKGRIVPAPRRCGQHLFQEYRVVLQTVVWAMVSRQVTIVGSGMRRIDDRGRHLRRDVGRLSRIDDAKTFKAAKKKLGIMSRRGRFGR